MENKNPILYEGYDAEQFRKLGHETVDMMADYLSQSARKHITTVLPDIAPQQMIEQWNGSFPRRPSEDYSDLMKRVVANSNHLHHPNYIGHQMTAPLPQAALSDFIGSLLNNGSAVYEMGPTNTIMEKRIIDWMAELIGFSKRADGILTSGGTLGNLTALLAARQAKTGYDVWSNGVDSRQHVTFLVSEQSHYSIKRALGIMGLGENGAVAVSVDEHYRMDVDSLRKKYTESINGRKKVIAVVASACSTATGSYDDLESIADFCEENDLWLHIDGAHGASALLSDKYKSSMKGIHRVDSIVWDAHKMLLMPALITAVIFKNGAHSYESFSQKASYLFEKEARDEWYNYAQRTMECTKYMMGLKLYAALMTYGTDYFADYITSRINLTKEFAAVIKETKDFELAVEPQCNIICFRYTPQGIDDFDALQKKIRNAVLHSESYYIVQTRLKDGFYLRCTIISPLTTLRDLKHLLQKIRELTAEII